jgi:hypothetical protein
MMSTAAKQLFGGGEAVRADVGATTGPGSGEEVVIEFTTTIPPSRISPPGGTAYWDIPEGEYLPIKLIRIIYPGWRD